MKGGRQARPGEIQTPWFKQRKEIKTLDTLPLTGADEFQTKAPPGAGFFKAKKGRRVTIPLWRPETDLGERAKALPWYAAWKDFFCR
ncbi:hypothetical protein UR09_00715 [Candidatus Nitromaritima sp. SCGC AAA799-A02]|nr:hypothetical protein UR09_00715 [Candidatus Nitromaritima sp. SCGC AAA799-A02]